MRRGTKHWPIALSLAALAACGNAPLDQTSVGTALYTVTGTLTADAEIAAITHPVKVAVVWAPGGGTTVIPHHADGSGGGYRFSGTAFTQSVDIVSTSLPASFSLAFREVPPLSMMMSCPDDDGSFQTATGEEPCRFAIGYFIAYEDRDGNDRFTLPTEASRELADRVLNLGIDETAVVYVEGTPPTGPAKQVLRLADLPASVAQALGKELAQAALLGPAAEGAGISEVPLEILGSGVDSIAPGFNLLQRDERWARYLAPGEQLRRCLDVAQFSAEGEAAVEACHGQYVLDYRQFEPLATLETCVASAGAEVEAKQTCVDAYVAAIVALMGVPHFGRQVREPRVELPMREDPQAGRAFCPQPTGTEPLAFDLERAVCAPDGLSYSIAARPGPSEWPTYCYGAHGFVDGERITDAASAPPWWPCEL